MNYLGVTVHNPLAKRNRGSAWSGVVEKEKDSNYLFGITSVEIHYKKLNRYRSNTDNT